MIRTCLQISSSWMNMPPHRSTLLLHRLMVDVLCFWSLFVLRTDEETWQEDCLGVTEGHYCGKRIPRGPSTLSCAPCPFHVSPLSLQVLHSFASHLKTHPNLSCAAQASHGARKNGESAKERIGWSTTNPQTLHVWNICRSIDPPGTTPTGTYGSPMGRVWDPFARKRNATCIDARQTDSRTRERETRETMDFETRDPPTLQRDGDGEPGTSPYAGYRSRAWVAPRLPNPVG